MYTNIVFIYLFVTIISVAGKSLSPYEKCLNFTEEVKQEACSSGNQFFCMIISHNVTIRECSYDGCVDDAIYKNETVCLNSHCAPLKVQDEIIKCIPFSSVSTFYHHSSIFSVSGKAFCQRMTFLRRSFKVYNIQMTIFDVIYWLYNLTSVYNVTRPVPIIIFE